jgi:hypothetical protein
MMSSEGSYFSIAATRLLGTIRSEETNERVSYHRVNRVNDVLTPQIWHAE